MEQRLPTHPPRHSHTPSLESPIEVSDFERFHQQRSSSSSTVGLIRRESDSSRDSLNLKRGPAHKRNVSNSFSPPDSPKVPLVFSMRPSVEKTSSMTGIKGMRGSVDSFDSGTNVPRMIRGKWFYARLRTVLYMFIWVAAATTFGLVVGVWANDYVPYKNAITSDRMFMQGTYQEMDPSTGGTGMKVRAWPPDIDNTGVYLIIAFCGTGMLLFFCLWLQNTYRSSQSYYVMFTKIEMFSLAAIFIWGLGFGGTAGYVTHVYKIENNQRDFWSWTCTRNGTAQETVYKSQIYYDGDCHMLFGSWITILTLCGFSFLALLTFPATMIYHAATKDKGYSRFEQKMYKQREIETRAEKKATRPREAWKFPKWAKRTN